MMQSLSHNFTFLCLSCFHKVKKVTNRCRESSGSGQCNYCSSPCISCEKCGNMMRQIDDNIIDIIILLNMKGYKTLSSCGGIGGHSIFVSMNAKDTLKKIPKGFTISRNRIDETLTVTILEHTLNEKQSDKEISTYVEILKEWVACIRDDR